MRRESSREQTLRRFAVSKLLVFVGASIGGYAGWALGAPVGIMTAFVVSVVGTGVGIYAGRRLSQELGS